MKECHVQSLGSLGSLPERSWRTNVFSYRQIVSRVMMMIMQSICLIRMNTLKFKEFLVTKSQYEGFLKHNGNPGSIVGTSCSHCLKIKFEKSTQI